MNDRDLRKFLKQTDNSQISHSKKQETVQLVSNRYVKNHHSSNVTVWTLIKNNIGYISTRFWVGELLCLLMLLAILPVIKGIENNKIGIFFVSMSTAILMILSLPELARSFRHGMWELEKTFRFSLKQLIASKLVIVSGIDIALLVFSAIIFSNILDASTLQLLLYTLVPFNLMSLTILVILHYKGYMGFVISVFIGWAFVISTIFVTDSVALIYESSHLWFWLAMFVSTGIALLIYVYKFMSSIQKEVFDKWNFQLID